MDKEQLQELFTERFLNNKIDSYKFISLMERVEYIREGTGGEMLKGAALGAAIGLPFIAMAMIVRKAVRDALKNTRECNQDVAKIIDPILKKKALAKCQTVALNKCLIELKRKLPKCKNDKNPGDCANKIYKGISFVEKLKVKVSKNL